MVHIEQLKGRENFDTWRTTAKSYLVIKGLWKFVDVAAGTIVSGDDNLRTISELTLLLDPVNYPYINEATTAAEAWANLCSAFEDQGTSRRVDTLQRLVTLRLENCSSMEYYCSTMMAYWIKVKNVGFKIESETVGSLMLGGLTTKYRPLVMGLENSGKNLTADYVKNVLLQDVPHEERAPSNGAAALWSKGGKHGQQKNQQRNQQKQNTRNNRSSSIKCFECGGHGHFSKVCPNRKKQAFKADAEDDEEEESAMLASLQASEADADQREPEEEEENAMLISLKAVVTSTDWFIDSGASSHMTNNKQNILEPMPVKNKSVGVANSSSLKVESCGDVRLLLDTKDRIDSVRLKNVIYVPGLAANLISVSQVIKNGNRIVFDKSGYTIFDQKGKIIALAKLVDDVYRLSCAHKVKALLTTPAPVVQKAKKLNADLWHRRLGHVSIQQLPLIRSVVAGMDFDENKNMDPCDTCAKGKQARLPFKHEGTRATELLELVHTDICGPMPVESIGKKKYFISFIDDYSRKTVVYVIRNKNEAFEKFKEYKSMAENQTSKTIKKLRSDGSGEYCSNEFELFLRTCGIVHKKSAPHTGQQNCVAERFYRTVVEKIRPPPR